jgi:hypothetical protein
MTRAKDLDTVAPDDMIVEVETKPIKIVEPVKEEIKKTILKPEIKKEKVETKENVDIYGLLGHSKSSFSSFLVRPKVLTFSERDDDEEIILALRPHWFTNVSWILTTIAMIFLPLIFKYFTFLAFLPLNYRLIALLFWFLITFIFAFEKFLGWYFDLYILTNERVIDISFNNLLNKKFAEADIGMIQDASSSVKGVAGTMFNYGTILIQTASEVNQIIFDYIPNPEKVIKVLQKLREEHEEKGGQV